MLGLSPDQLQGIGVALFGTGFLVLVVVYGPDVPYNVLLWLLVLITAGAVLVGYGAGLRKEYWG